MELRRGKSWQAIMRQRYMVIISCALVITGCGQEKNPTGLGTGSVMGVLTDLETGVPVRDGRVALLEPNTLRTASASTPTDATGRYWIDSVPMGEYALVVYHDNLVIFDWPSPLLAVKPGRVTKRDLRLQYSGLWSGDGPRVSGTVIDTSTSEPVAGAYVGSSDLADVDIEAPFFGTTLPEMAVTDALGRFTLKYCCRLCYAGKFCIPPITVTKSGYEPFTLVGRGPEVLPGLGSMLPAPDSVLVLKIHLRREMPDAPRGTVRGRLAFAGEPVSGMRVALSLAMASQPDTFPSQAGKVDNAVIAAPLPDRVAVSGSTGTFQIKGVPFGTYQLVAAYLADDGFVSGWLREAKHPMVVVTDSAAVDVGTVELAKALRPLNPPDGSITSERSPEIRWEPLAGLPEGYSLTDYVLNIDDQYMLRTVIRNLREPRWRVSSSLRLNAHMRWIVEARVVRAGSPDTLILGKMERAATFTVGSAVAITVGPGTTPTFSWLPADSVSWLGVGRTTGDGQWVVTTGSINAILPPVRYGQVPTGGRELLPPTTLRRGVSYVVILAKVTPSGITEPIALQTFIP